MGRVLGARPAPAYSRRDARRRAARAARPPRAARLRGRTTSPTCAATRFARAALEARCSTRSCARPGSRSFSLPGRHAHDASRPASRSASPTTRRSSARSRPRTRRGLPPDQAEDRTRRRRRDRCRGARRGRRRRHARGRRQRLVRTRGRDNARRARSIRAAVPRAAARTRRAPRPRELAKRLTTPIALDESVTSAHDRTGRDRVGVPVASSTSNPAGSAESREAKRVHDAVRRRRDGRAHRRDARDRHRTGRERRARRASRVHRGRRPVARRTGTSPKTSPSRWC